MGFSILTINLISHAIVCPYELSLRIYEYFTEMLQTYYHISIIFWIKYDLGQKYYGLQVRPDQGSNS